MLAFQLTIVVSCRLANERREHNLELTIKMETFNYM